MKRIFIDFETYSNVPITLGPYAYVNGSAFRAVSMAYAIENGPIKHVAEFSRIPSDILKAGKAVVFIADNANFDSAVYSKVYGAAKRLWLDTQALKRYASIPAGLDRASAFFGLPRKLEVGKDLLRKPISGAVLTPEELKALGKYNDQDVRILRLQYKILTPVQLDPFSVGVLNLHREMNESGMDVDQVRARKLLSMIQNEKTNVEKKSRKSFGVYGKDQKAIATSAAQVKAFLAKAGFEVESIAEKELEDFLAVSGSKLPKRCKDLILAYRELQSRGADKLALIVENKVERIYDSSIYHGAHTGRPTGGGINLLNVKRYTDGDDSAPFDKALKRIVKEAKPGERVKRLSSLLWGCLIPDTEKEVIIRSDLSAIEPRVGAWLRDDLKTLDIYRRADDGTGKDEYTIFGESMNFPAKISRNLSKIVILAACYGMGPPRFQAQCRQWGMPDPGEKEAEKILEGYHRRNPSVKRVWFNLIKLAISAIEKPAIASSGHNLGMRAEKIGGKLFLAVLLPSGRVKRYADVRIETRGTNGWKTFSYIDPLKGFRQTVPAAGLYENIVQAIAFDVSCEKAFQIQTFAKVKLIIHDEINVSTVKKNAERMKKIMCAPVAWLPGMPVSSKTSVCRTFHKGDLI